MKNSKPIILVVEGVDCVGKTMLAKAIALKYGFQYLYTPQIPLVTIRREIERLNDPNARFFYYLTSVISVQKIIQTALSDGKSLIIDRYIHSTFVMHEMLGVDVSCVNFEKLPIFWPTVSILLTAQSETRNVRKSGRDGLQDYDEHIEQSTGLLDLAQQAFLSTQQWSLIIETDYLSAEQVESKVMLFLLENSYV